MKFLSVLAALFYMLPLGLHAQLTATANTTQATCPNTGKITVNASGGSGSYNYSITDGPLTRPSQPSNEFNNLPVGTYTVQVTDGASTFNLTNVSITSSYQAMQPTAVATNEQCGGSNTGSIKLSFAANQGTPPYTYTIESGPTSATPVTNTSNSYTFQNLAPGLYSVRVTDACGSFQTREATLTATAIYNLDVTAYARPAACNNMDFYVRPGRGAEYPHTYYAFENGNPTPVASITVNASDLVPIPGASPYTGFKFTLPNPPSPAPAPATYYTFKYTDACVTNINDARVHATTPSLWGYQTSSTVSNCNLQLTEKVLEGWKMPVTVDVTPSAGGTTVSQSINDETSRTATFPSLTPGSYNITITDNCGRTITFPYNFVQPALGSTINYECGSNIPGTATVSVSGLTAGWQQPVTGTITSGPTSYYSSMMDQTFTATYPISTTNAADTYLRFRNLPPGTYSLTMTDGCNTKTVPFTVQANLASYTIPPEVVSGCAGSRKVTGATSTTCGTSFYVDVKRGPAETIAYGNGVGATNGFVLSSPVPADTYTFYYYSKINSTYTNVLTIPASDIYNNDFLIKKTSLVVTDQPTNPTVSGVNTAKCTDGSVSVQLIPGGSSGAITGYEMQNPDGSWGALQASPVFSVSDYGTYNFRLTDECGNSNVNAVSVKANPVPEIKTGDNKCLGGDITLYVDLPTGATATWTKPNGSTVQGAQILIQNASTSDEGTYTVAVKYAVGNCIEVQTTSIELNDCITLPVDWGTVSAKIADGVLYVNWKTLKETNNSYFNIQISNDGVNWKTIEKVASSAKDGNSETETEYQYKTNYADVLTVFGSSVLIGLIGFGFKKRNKYISIAMIAAVFVIGGIIISCQKKKDSVEEKSKAPLFIRIEQVDKDGKSKMSSVVKAIRE